MVPRGQINKRAGVVERGVSEWLLWFGGMAGHGMAFTHDGQEQGLH